MRGACEGINEGNDIGMIQAQQIVEFFVVFAMSGATHIRDHFDNHRSIVVSGTDD
jgi:hypothetical protein